MNRMFSSPHRDAHATPKSPATLRLAPRPRHRQMPRVTLGTPTVIARLGSDQRAILCEYPRDLQPVVEDERMVAGLVPGAPHLHDAKLALHAELALAREAQVEDPIREVLLLVPRVRRPGRPVRTRIGRQLA